MKYIANMADKVSPAQGAVLSVAVGSFFLLQYLGIQVSKQRVAAGVPYPYRTYVTVSAMEYFVASKNLHFTRTIQSTLTRSMRKRSLLKSSSIATNGRTRTLWRTSLVSLSSLARPQLRIPLGLLVLALFGC